MATSTQTKPTVKIEKPPYSFGSKEFDNLKKNLLSTEPLNPDNEIKKFNAVVQSRGYIFFSDESIADWKKQYDHISNSDINTWAEGDKILFMHSVKNISDPDHNKNRLLFETQFEGSELKVKDYFLDINNALYGRDNVPLKNTSYEGRALHAGLISTNHAAFEAKTMQDLFRAKWSAMGYFRDDEYKEKFLNDYAIALKSN